MTLWSIPLPVIVRSGAHVVGDFTAEIASGAISIGEVTTNISGQPVMISGQPVYVESGVHVVGDFPIVESGIGVVVQSGVRVIGDFTTEVASGLYVIVGSGVHVVGDFTAEVSVSGQPVTISGQTVVIESGLNVVGEFSTTVESGLHVVPEIPNMVKTGKIKPITSASGGEVLNSGPVLSLGIKAHYDNSGDIYVGGNTIDNFPYSGYGLLLKAGGAVNMDITNINRVHVVSVISGDRVTYMGLF